MVFKKFSNRKETPKIIYIDLFETTGGSIDITAVDEDGTPSICGKIIRIVPEKGIYLFENTKILSLPVNEKGIVRIVSSAY